MAKLDKNALKEQGEELKAHLAMAKKRTLNFAILQGKEGLVVVANPKGNPGLCRKEAKTNGGGPKGIMGQMRAEGKTVIFVVDEEPPGNFPKLIRQHFMARGATIKKIVIELPGGGTLSDGEEDIDGEGDGENPGPVMQESTADGDGGRSNESPTGEGEGDEVKTADKTADKPAADTLGPVLMKAYGLLKAEMKEKRGDAEEALQNALATADQGFRRAMESKEYEQAKAMLSQIKKALAKIQPKSIFEQVVDTVKDKVEDIVEDVSEVIEQKKQELGELGDKIVEKVEDIAQGVGDMLGILSEHDKEQKEKLKEFDLPETQQLALVKLARDNPKSFDAALKVLAKMEGEHGDLVPTAAGVADAKKAVDDANAAQKVLVDEQKAIMARYNIAKAAAEAAAATVAATDTQYKQALEALNAFKKSMPKDPSKLSKEDQLKLVNEMNALIKAEAELKIKRAADFENAKTTKATQNTEADAWHAKTPGIEAAKAKVGAEQDKAKATKVKKDMMDAVSLGVLSPTAENPMSDADIAKVLGAFEADPALGQKALGLLEKSKDRAMLADGIDRVTKGMGNGFKDKDGNAYGDEAAQKKYAQDSLEMGAAMGGDYFKNMEKFVEGGGLNKPDPATVPGGSSFKKLEQTRAKYVGDSMVGPDGKIDTKSPAAQEALAMMNYHPGSMLNKTPGMNMHFDAMSKAMDDPKHKQKCQDVLDGITTPPTSETGKKLVARNIGKAEGDVTKDDVKSSVMSAMFTPLDQGPVGSCFATGPARRVIEEDPAKAMGSMTEIAMKGRFTTAQGDKIKAISTDKLPADDNQLMRSYEYTVATAGAMLEDSSQRKSLGDNLFAGPNGLNGIKGQLPDETKWPEIRVKLEAALVEKLTFRYDATSKISGSNDGSSTKGNFQIIDKSNNEAVITKEEFIKVITRLALEAAGETEDTETGGKIVDLCKSDAFISAVCPGKYKPWELPGGGRGSSSSKVLNGGEPTDTPMSDDNWKKEGDVWVKIDPPGERTKKVVTDMIGRFAKEGPDSKMLDLRTTGIHAFGGLPNHPSLAKLKEGDDPAAAIEKYILKPGQDMAKADLAAEKTGMLFDKQLDTMAGWKLFSGGAALLETARGQRPTTAMKPAELKAHVDTVTQPLRDYMATERAKEWKKTQEDAGKVVSNTEFNKKVDSLKSTVGTWSDNEFSNNIIDNLEPPQFVIADTNWGDRNGHTFFVVIPDPITGEAKMFSKQEPSGKLTALEDKWLDTSWQVTE